MSIEAKVFKEELHDNHVAASNNVHSSLTEKSPSQAVEKKLQDKGDVQETLHQQVKSSAGTEIEISDGIPQLLNEILDVLEGPKELCPSSDKSAGSAKSTEEIKPDDVEVVDIVTVKQYQREKLHALNDNFQNALKSFQPSYNKKPVEKKLEYRRDASKIPKTLKDDILPPRKQFVHPQSGPSKPNEKPSTINPPVSKQELKKFQRQNFAKDTSQSSAKDSIM
uniref:Uncharacterized protein n=1 Tax=Panagrolaimus superbus TaxID=310955 RepID=A0A914Z0K5_9BILA